MKSDADWITFSDGVDLVVHKSGAVTLVVDRPTTIDITNLVRVVRRFTPRVSQPLRHWVCRACIGEREPSGEHYPHFQLLCSECMQLAYAPDAFYVEPRKNACTSQDS